VSAASITRRWPAPSRSFCGGRKHQAINCELAHVAPPAAQKVRPTAVSLTTPDFSASNRDYPDSFIGGGQIGYNWQVSPIWVVGFEADFQGAVEKDSEYFNAPFSFIVPVVGGPPGDTSPVTGTVVTNYTTKIDWFGTARARLGYVWGNGNVLTYVTGGLAYGKVDLEGTSTISGTALGLFSITDTFGHSQVNTGWVVGYGTEGVIDFWGARNWTWKIESLYMDLGHLTGVTTGTSVNLAPPPSVTGGQVTTNSHFIDGILRAGLNYKFY
jgi:outer membrane immunogenic protein